MTTLYEDISIPPPIEFLTKADRCDQCNAAAKVRAQKKGAKLLFCQHHANKHLNKLTEQEWIIFNN